MYLMSYERLILAIRGSIYETLIIIACLAIAFIALEPVISRAVSDDFTVTQTITGAIAFAQNPGDIAMNGTIDGLTGGTAYGTTSARITTNNATGYNMTISFSSTTAMIRNGAENNAEILNFQYSTGTADYPSGFDTSVAYAQIGFTPFASTTSEVSDVFTDTGGVCGTNNNGSFTIFNCWRGASTTDAGGTTELINTSGPTPASGSSSTVTFRITVPNNPNPAVPSGTYVATATLTATDNP